ncbi:CHRD domain-containing protein [Lacibacter cauensis]|uniref:CHRD domain-containing protein n=1 Tax=Lacibacter cauensis TaxID=510947 RepID=A0A562SKF0_9BACT|nr:CHRD domain-containing protein [Lacibacter cauensis]TWI81725.1 CHRD domain-containing protein [Lacibacter cauensis]
MKQLLLFICGSVLFFSCKKNNSVTQQPTVIKEFTLNLSAKNENPAPAGRNETGVFVLKIMSDNSVQYNITVSGLSSTDALTSAHIHTGNPVVNGGVILNFTPTFTGGAASGTVKDVRTTLLDSMKNEAVDLYVNVHSSQVGSGLVRAQLNKTVEWTQDVALAGSNEVPAVTTTANGTARFRLTSDGTIYYLVNVTGLTAGDGTLTAAHIHNGAAGTNGSVLLALASGAADFGVDKKVVLTDVQKTAITGTSAIYVNAHSSTFPGGLLRGQIR